ncbi:MAG: antibiotic biosynthesis monooxygenase [Lentisphaeria bacterium]|nr:antibiotic biosynthesis monooxygenase [Lentisphaeria bacterium]
MIHVVAAIQVKPGCRENVIQAIKENLANVLAEDGCLGYSPAVDIDAGLPPQGDMREHVITIVEGWESLAALHAHLATAHMAAYREKVKDWVEGVDLQVMEVVD